jgi:hypothetical protein
LPGNKTEAGLARHLELKMLGLIGQRFGSNQADDEILKWRHQMIG